MENESSYLFFGDHCSTFSESTTEPANNSNRTSTTSFTFERRMFENIAPQTQNTNILLASTRNFKHLETSGLSEENEYQAIKKKTHIKIKNYRRSTSLPSGMDNFLDQNSPPSDKKLMSSSTDRFPFSSKELIQPLASTSRTHISDIRYDRKPIKTLDKLELLKKGTTEFNKQFCKDLKKFLDHDNQLSQLTKLPSSAKLEKRANEYFESEVKKVTKEKHKLKRTTSIQLAESRQIRAQAALRHVQKSMVLLTEIIPRLQYLQNAIFKILTEENEKQTIFYKTEWIDNFFKGLDDLISSYAYKLQEMNPLKSFTHNFAIQFKDAEMVDYVLLCLGIKKKEFVNVMNCLNWWADSLNIAVLTQKVITIENDKIEEKRNLNIENIENQQHEWFESLNSPCPISQITISEVVRCLIPDTMVLYEEITVNEKLIYLNNSNENSENRQLQFFTSLLYTIYSSGFDASVNEKQAETQAKVIVEFNKICKSLKEDLFGKNISWETIQLKLKEFPAIPFSSLKYHFDPILNENNFEEFLLELSIPCINILRLCTNSCWLRGDDCIRCLFTNIFKPMGDNDPQRLFKTASINGTHCHIHIKNSEEYLVTQTKIYGTYNYLDPLSTTGKPVNFARTSFKWSVGPYKDYETGFSCWRGFLEIPHVDIDEQTPFETRKEFLKILNNPNIVDYVVNSLDGKPKIISTRIELF